MLINQLPFLEFIGQPRTRFVIPVFQRVYSWNARQCEELWEDIVNAGRAAEQGDASASQASHFMGIVLYSPDTEAWQGCKQLDIIDGQQRMTTLTLLIAALCLKLEEQGGKVGNMTAPALRETYLKTGATATRGCKLVLSQMDRDTLAALVGTGEPPEEPAQRLIDNLQLFSSKIDQAEVDLDTVWRGMQALEIASVELAVDDSPQLVFESLNSKGMPLSTADRVRNFLIASTDGSDQDHLHDDCWAPLEERTANAEEPTTVTAVLHAWLAERYRDVRIVDESEIYGLFKSRLRTDYDGSLERLLADVATYCDRYLADAEFREEAAADAEAWAAGKPKELISEYKMFGD